MIVNEKYLSKNSDNNKTNQIVFDMYELIQVNNQLINRLIKEMHYLTNPMLEQERIIKSINGQFSEKKLKIITKY